ncbi:hypothetical protein [Spiroplasma poulsonii]|nr:hypothetical protein [Spiroplasma poulsonii]
MHSNAFNIAVNELNVGRYNNTNLRVGTYNRLLAIPFFIKILL